MRTWATWHPRRARLMHRLFPCRPANAATAPAPPWSGRRWRPCSTQPRPTRPRRPRHRRRHRRVRGPGGRARPPGHRGRPQPRRPGRAGPPGPRGRRRGHRAVQGDLACLLDAGHAAGADLVLCHGVLEVVDDPAAALAAIREVLRPGGRLSLLVAQRHAAVIARAMAGHVAQALALLDDAHSSRADRPHRAPVHRRRGHRAARRRRLRGRLGARRPGLRRPGPRRAPRPRARRHRRAARARAGGPGAARVPPAGDSAARHRARADTVTDPWPSPGANSDG